VSAWPGETTGGTSALCVLGSASPQRRELLAAIPVHDQGELFAEHYGLGIYRVQLPCGIAWGHDGGYPGGFKTFAYTGPDGYRQAVIVYNDFKMSEPLPAGTGRRVQRARRVLTRNSCAI
jgi:D-alanyl-D-alanine carboxypeptidase